MEIKNCNAEAPAQSWEITVKGAEWQKFIRRAEQNLKKHIKVPGFRVGSAPEAKWKTMVSQTQILREAHRIVFPRVYRFALNQIAELRSRPQSEVKKIDFQRYCLNLSWTNASGEQFKIKQYQNLTVPVTKKVSISSDDVTKKIKAMQKEYGSLVNVNRKAKMGDVLVIDYEAYLHDQKIKYSKITNLRLELGAGQLLADFESQLVGVVPHQLYNIKVKITAQHLNPQLRNQTVTFKVKVLRLCEYVLVSLQELIAKAKLEPEVKTVSKLKAYVQQQLQQEQEAKVKSEFIDALMLIIAKDSQLKPAPRQLHQEFLKSKNSLVKQLAKQNWSLQTYKRKTGVSNDWINSELLKDAKLTVLTEMIVAEVSQREKINPTPVQVTTKLNQLRRLRRTSSTPQQTAEYLTPHHVRRRLVRGLTIDFLFQHNKSSTTPTAAKQQKSHPST